MPGREIEGKAVFEVHAVIVPVMLQKNNRCAKKALFRI
jgi:hypothetical protein